MRHRFCILNPNTFLLISVVSSYLTSQERD